MANKVEDKHPNPPTPEELGEMLGRVTVHWNDLCEHLNGVFEPVTSEWKRYSKKAPWTFRLQRKKRTIIYLTPDERSFVVTLVYGEKAVKIAGDSNLPPDTMKLINEAKKYVEGRPIRIQVRSKKALALVKKLAAIKMSS